MAEIATKQPNDLNFGRRKTLRKLTITFNVELLRDTLHFHTLFAIFFTNLMNSPTILKLQSRVSKSNLNMMNIYEEAYHQFQDMAKKQRWEMHF